MQDATFILVTSFRAFSVRSMQERSRGPCYNCVLASGLQNINNNNINNNMAGSHRLAVHPKALAYSGEGVMLGYRCAIKGQPGLHEAI